MRRGELDVNLFRGLGWIDSKDEFIYTGGFKIKIDDGSYEYIEETPRDIERSVNVINLNRMRYYIRIYGKDRFVDFYLRNRENRFMED